MTSEPRDLRDPPSTSNSPDQPQPLKADTGRQAMSSLEGYWYQIQYAVYAWIELGPDEVLYLEVAEDYDRVSKQEASAYQLKHTTAPVTLRSESVVSAISNYWKLRQDNPDRAVRFHFVTTSEATVEKGSPFGDGIAGLTLWKSAQQTIDAAARADTAGRVKDFLLSDAKVSEDVRRFLNVAENERVYNELIAPVHWDTSAPDRQAVEHAIGRRLQHFCWQRGITVDYATKVFDRLQTHALATATSKENRRLSSEDFFRIFEEITTLRVPQTPLANYLAGALPSGLESVAAAMGGPVAPLQVTPGAERLTSVPPAPPSALQRPALTATLLDLCNRHGVVVIHGSTGMGKTTEAALTARALGGDWFWASCRSADDAQTRTLLSALGRWLDNARDHRLVVLDDIDLSRQLGALEAALPGLLFTVRARAGAVIVTGHGPLTQRLRLAANISDECMYAIRPFEEADVDAYLLNLGLTDSKLRSTWASAIHLGTHGHPQLVAARGTKLRQAGFPRPSADDLIQTPIEIREAQSEARRLLSRDLSQPARELLYRLSLLTGWFSRDRALAISEISDALPNGGDAFDEIVGPWIERPTDDLYQVSPLIQSAGKDAKGASWAKGMHAAIAARWAEFKQQTPSYISSVLFHAVMGEDGAPIARLGWGLFKKDEKVWASIAAADPIFVHVYLHPGQRFPYTNPFEVFWARYIQFRLAATTQPALGISILDRAEQEFPADDLRLPIQMIRQLLLSLVISHPNVPLPLARVAKTVEETAAITDRLSTAVGGKDLIPPSNDEVFGNEGKFDVRPALGLALLQRVTTVEQLKELVQVLDSMEASLRHRALRMFAVDEDGGRHLADSVWLSEYKTVNPRWGELAETLGDLYSRLTAWNEMRFAASVASVRARILGENLADIGGARAFGELALRQCGDVSYLLLSQQAHLARQAGDKEKALAIWRSMLDKWAAAKHANTVAVAQAMRMAAITAAEFGLWGEAASLFHRGASLGLHHSPIFRIGLVADAAYAHWRNNEGKQAVALFLEAVKGLASVPNDPSEIGSYYLHKIIGHVLTWINRSLDGDATADAPIPGCCSNPEPTEQVKALPPTPIDYSLLHIVAAAYYIDLSDAQIDGLAERLRTSPYPAVRVRIVSELIDHQTKKCQLDELLILVAELAGAIALAQRDRALERPIWEASTEPVVRDLSAPDPGPWLPFLCSGLLAAAEHGTSITDVIGRWRSDADDVKASETMNAWLDMMRHLSIAPTPDVFKTVNEQGHWAWRLGAAAIFLGRDNVSLRSLLYCHATLITFAESPGANHFASGIACALARAWLLASERPFALRSPATTVPRLVAAAKSGQTWKATASMLLAARDATGYRLPESVIMLAQKIASAN